MRGSFGGSYGMGRSSGGSSGGGGGSDGGGMLRTMGRVVRRAGYNSLQDPLSSSSSSSSSSALKSPAKKLTQKPNSYKHPTLSISSSSSINSTANNSSNLLVSGGNWPVSTIPTWFSTANDDDDDGGDDDDFSGFDDQWEYVGDSVDRVFGAVPSDFEVQNAFLSLQQVIPQISTSSRFSNSETISDTEKDAMEKASSGSSDSDWIEPSMQIGFAHQRFPRSSGLDRVYDAFHLLQTEPNVQRMVLSLSSDKAVWDAIMNNEAVREIRDSYYNEAAESSPLIPVEDPDASDTNPNVLVWIFDNMKVKLLEVIGAISEFFGEMFKPLEEDETEHLDSEEFSERLKSTFLLTIVVLLIVVVARGQSD